MSTLAIQVIAIALVAVHLRAPLRVSAAVLIASTFFIPAAILFPEAPAYLFVLRLGLWAAVAGVFIRAATGEIENSALRPSRVLIAFFVFLAAMWVFGVASAPFPSQSERAFELWLLLVDQMLFLWAATVFVRVLGVRFVALTTVSSVVAVAVVAIGERITGGSYAHWWFRHQRVFLLPGQVLEQRGGDVRVRATGEFSLQFAWVMAFFAPLVGIYAMRARRLVAYVAPALVGLAIVLTVTRSVFAGLGVGVIALLVFARGDRRLIGTLLLGATAAGLLYLGSEAVREPYQAADPESVSVRTRRLDLLTGELARHPWTGIGLDGAVQRGFTSTDSSALATYSGAGVVGVVALVGVFGTAVITAAAAGITAHREAAPLAGAVVGGLGAAGLGMFAFDSLSGPFASWSLWLLAALAVGLYEEAAAARPGPLRPRSVRLSRRRLMLPAFGLAVGCAVYALAPMHVAAQLRIFTLSPRYLAATSSGKSDFVGRLLVQATCDSARAAFLGSGVGFDCFDPLQAGPGTGLVRIEAASGKTLAAAEATFSQVVRRVHRPTRVAVVSPPQRARPTWARTAPLTATLLFAELALLLPSARFRRRVAGAPTTSSSRERSTALPAYR